MPRTRITLISIAGAAMTLVALTAPAAQAATPDPGTLQLVDVSSVPGVASTNNEHVGNAAISDDGRFVVFASSAQDLLRPTSASHEADEQIYLRDTVSNTTRLISAAAGVPGDHASYSPTISSDGMLVAYLSSASNLAPRGVGGVWQAYVWSAITNSSTLISTSYESPRHGVNLDVTGIDIAASGNAVVYSTAATDVLPGDPYGVPRSRVYRLDAATGTTEIVERDPALSASAPSISADGLHVGFVSADAHTTVPTGGIDQGYVMDMASGIARLVSVDATGSGAANAPVRSVDVSGDGAFVAFDSSATDISAAATSGGAHVYRRSITSGTTTVESRGSGGAVVDGSAPSISASGSSIAFTQSRPRPGSDQVWLRSIPAGTSRLLSMNRLPESGNGNSMMPFISPSGQFITWSTLATNLTADSYPYGSLHASLHTMLINVGPGA